jgi:NADH-quinone oxidoreductase subunit F
VSTPREPIVEYERRFDRPGTQVLQRLRAIRDERGQITGGDVDVVAGALGLPRAHVYGAVTFFEELGLRRRGARHVQVCAGTACFAASGGRHIPAVERELGLSRGGCAPDGSVSLQPVYCLGYCYGGPSALDNEQACAGPDLVDQLAGRAPRRDPDIPAYSAVEQPVLLAGILDGEPSWKAWPEVVGGGRPDDVTEMVIASGLRGRGGAGFPVGHKWRSAASAATPGPRYIIVNGDEGDPGSYIDRLLLQRDPHRVLEGAALAGYAARATQGYIYVRSEYPAARDALQAALRDARAAGHLGRDVHGSGVDFDVEIVEGAGSYVAGEETSLIHSMEGLRGGTLARPPFPTTQGLFNYPTVVNNVESVATVPWIVEHGGASYAALGYGDEHGQRLVCVNAGFERPGVYEVPLGVRIGHILEDHAGGLKDGRRLRSVQIGGPLGGFLGADKLDLPLSGPALVKEGVSLGHASLLGFDDTIPGRAIMRHLWRFAAAESCGTCSPCRIGSRRGLEYSRRGDVAELEELCETLTETSLCAFGSGVAQAVRSVMRVYADEFASEAVPS